MAIIHLAASETASRSGRCTFLYSKKALHSFQKAAWVVKAVSFFSDGTYTLATTDFLNQSLKKNPRF